MRFQFKKDSKEKTREKRLNTQCFLNVLFLRVIEFMFTEGLICFLDFRAGKPLQFKCVSCYRKYTNKNSLWKHRKYYCGKQPRFRCIRCGYLSYQKANLKKHVAKCGDELL